MAIEIVITTNRWKNDPISRELVDHLKHHQDDLSLTKAILYYDFPAYADYEASVFRPDVLLFSPYHGFIAIRAFEHSVFKRSPEDIGEIDLALDDFVSKPPQHHKDLDF